MRETERSVQVSEGLILLLRTSGVGLFSLVTYRRQYFASLILCGDSEGGISRRFISRGSWL